MTFFQSCVDSVWCSKYRTFFIGAVYNSPLMAMRLHMPPKNKVKPRAYNGQYSHAGADSTESAQKYAIKMKTTLSPFQVIKLFSNTN